MWTQGGLEPRRSQERPENEPEGGLQERPLGLKAWPFAKKISRGGKEVTQQRKEENLPESSLPRECRRF